MADGTNIEWTDSTWQIVTGCTIVSPGCTNCYAMTLAGGRLQNHPSRAGLTKPSKAGPVWTGEVRFNEKWLMQPLGWTRPRMIFVAAHGDLFHENVPDAWLDNVFAVMALAGQHQFQVLTKRSARARAYLSAPGTVERIYDLVCDMTTTLGLNVVLIADRAHEAAAPKGRRVYLGDWPLKNVWLGISAEDQKHANLRVPDLLQTPAAIRFVSAEPLLGPIDFTAIRYTDEDAEVRINALTAEAWVENSDSASAYSDEADGVTKIDWIIVGAESGSRARPCDVRWVQSIRDQMRPTDSAFFLKQLSGPGGRAKKDMEEFPTDLRIRAMPMQAPST